MTDRGIVAWSKNKQIHTTPFTKLKEVIDAGDITPDSIIFNNSISTFGEIEKNWQIAAKNSWVKRYFK